MLSYQHGYHAGNFADVLKHAVLVTLVRALQRKDKPCCVLETHSGRGAYDLTDAFAAKTGEWRDGIGRLWAWPAKSAALADYLAQVRAVNDGELQSYPGSPALVRGLLRPQDRLLLCELHPAEHQALAAHFAGHGQVAVHRRDGYEALKALLPPVERRGLVFIDPSYETADEYARVLEGIAMVQRRWPQATVAVWYPILDRRPSARFLERVRALGVASLVAELGVAPYTAAAGMAGSGVVVINPPWQVDAQLGPLLEECQRALANGPAGQRRLEWLIEE